MRVRFCLLLCLAIFSGTAQARSRRPKKDPAFIADKVWLGQELARIQLPKSFITKALANYEPDSFKTVVTLNLLGFLQPAQHMNNVTPESVRETARFISDNQEAFAQAEQTYHVPSDIISSLLWIETRHGENTGDFHTASVFMHLLQVERSKTRGALTKLALEKNKKLKKYSAKELRRLIAERTQTKRAWARDQLGALAVLWRHHQLDVKSLRGSYAGAFGLPQFIPSSYRDFAKSAKPARPADLNAESDAIVSVANYLAVHGWDTSNEEARVTALMKYNNSRDYADSILEISRRVTALAPTVLGRQERNVSSSAESVTTPSPAGK
jgi:membrane-bound lytic murein transglycosylase B